MIEKNTTIDIFCNSLRIDQSSDDKSCRLAVRRVSTQDRGEHVQIEVDVNKHHANRTTTQHFSLSLDPEQAAVLVTALTKLHPPFTDTDRLRSFAEDRKIWGEFYGLGVAS